MSNDGGDDPLDGQEEQLDNDQGNDEPKDDDGNPDQVVDPDADPDDKDPDDEDSKPPDDGEPKEPVDIGVESQKLRDLLKEGLTQVSRTPDNSSFAFAHLNATGKEIENVYDVLSGYPYIRYLLINENKLKSLDGVEKMHSLLYLDSSQNALKSSQFLGVRNTLTFLQHVNLSINRLKTLEPIQLPRLKKLYLDENRLRDIEGVKDHRGLELLSVKKNKIKHLNGVEGLTKLKELYLDENSIKSMDGLGRLPSLEILSLQTNQIKELPEQIPVLPRLKRLNLAENKLTKFKDIPRLLSLANLVDLSLNTNPYEEELGGDARKQLIILLCIEHVPEIRQVRILNRVNEEELNEEEMSGIIDELKQLAEEERIRKEEEEEQKRIADEEERQRKLEEEEQERVRKEEEMEAERVRKLEEEEELRKNQPAPVDQPGDGGDDDGQDVDVGDDPAGDDED